MNSFSDKITLDNKDIILFVSERKLLKTHLELFSN